MERTKIVDFKEFMTQVLPRPTVAVPKTPKKFLFQIQTKFRDFFPQKKRDHTVRFKEDELAETMVEIINDHHLCGGYVAALARSGFNSTNPKGANVDAMIYPQDWTPADDQPDWTHSRMFINFQRGGSRYDPFENKVDNPWSRTDARPYADARPQLFAQAHNTMLYQHRTAVYALFINGPEFRGMRYDRAGLIVSKATNYVNAPAALLEILATFGHLDDEAQGLDPTATLIDEHSAAFKLMDEYAKDPGSDMEYKERTIIHPHSRPPNDSFPPYSAASSSSTQYDATPLASRPVRCSPRLRAKQANSSGRAAADAACKHDSDLDIEALPEDEDPRVFKYVRERYRKSLQGGWPRYKLRVGKEKRVFLVGMPTFCSDSLFGRCTRGYVALDARSRRFVFLKDSWRPHYENVESEGFYLDLLGRGPHAHEFVPRLLCHGDVDGQTTFSMGYQAATRSRFDPYFKTGDEPQAGVSTSPQPLKTTSHAERRSSAGSKRSRNEYEESEREENASDHGSCPVESEAPAARDYRHYRIVSKDVCLPFDSFTSAEQLVRLLSNCVLGHGYAYEDHGLLHRDISAGNVLILPGLKDAPESLGPGAKMVIWTGVLTDWELAKFVSKHGSSQDVQRPERTGTWQFMSVHHIQHHAKRPVTIADELESFFHVLLFYAVRRLHSSVECIPGFVSEYFDGHDPVGGPRYCSVRKRAAMKTGSILSDRGWLEFYVEGKRAHRRFQTLIDGLLAFFHARYSVLEYDALEGSRASLARFHRSLEADPPQHDIQFRSRGVNPWKDQASSVHSSYLRGLVEETPSEETRALADELKTHGAFYNVFDWVLDHNNRELPAWPRHGDVKARTPASSDPRDMVLALDKMVADASRDTRDEVWKPRASDDDPPPPKRYKTTTGSEPPAVRKPTSVRPATAPHNLEKFALAGRRRRAKLRRARGPSPVASPEPHTTSRS
ncbi:hypothetical protein BD413DRAFT_578204 [Trametes elegans]|nr:hypothetical protein BD413DRAFT_578204 [Trametes elegans]